QKFQADKNTEQSSKGKKHRRSKTGRLLGKMQDSGIDSHRQRIRLRSDSKLQKHRSIYRRGNREITQVKATRGINKAQEKQIRQQIKVRWGTDDIHRYNWGALVKLSRQQ